MRVPVDQTFAAIDQALVVHLNKDFDHAHQSARRRASPDMVKASAIPIARRAKALELVDDRDRQTLLSTPKLSQGTHRAPFQRA